MSDDTLKQILRVTGMGKLQAEAFLKHALSDELAMVKAGNIRDAVDTCHSRLLNAGTPSGTSPAKPVSETDSADEAVE